MSEMQNPDRQGLSHLQLDSFSLMPTDVDENGNFKNMIFKPKVSYIDNTIDHQTGDVALDGTKTNQGFDLRVMNQILELNHQKPMNLKLLNNYVKQLQSQPGANKQSEFPFRGDVINGHKLRFQSNLDTLAKTTNSANHNSTSVFTQNLTVAPMDYMLGQHSFVTDNVKSLSDDAKRLAHREDTNLDANYHNPRIEQYLASANVVPSKDGKDVVIRTIPRQRRDIDPFNENAGSFTANHERLNPSNPLDNFDSHTKDLSLAQFNKILAVNGKQPLTRDKLIQAFQQQKPLATGDDNLAFTTQYTGGKNQIGGPNFDTISGSKFKFDFPHVEHPLNQSVAVQSATSNYIQQTNPDVYARLSRNPYFRGAGYQSDMANHLPNTYLTSPQFERSAGQLYDQTHPVRQAMNGIKRFTNGVKARKARFRLFRQKFRQHPAMMTGALIGHCIVGSIKMSYKAIKALDKGAHFVGGKVDDFAEHRVNSQAMRADFSNIDEHGLPSVNSRLSRYRELTRRAVKANTKQSMIKAEEFYRAARLDKACLQPNMDAQSRFQLITQHYANVADITDHPQDIARAKAFMKQKDQIFGTNQQQSTPYDTRYDQTATQTNANLKSQKGYAELHPDEVSSSPQAKPNTKASQSMSTAEAQAQSIVDGLAKKVAKNKQRSDAKDKSKSSVNTTSSPFKSMHQSSAMDESESSQSSVASSSTFKSMHQTAIDSKSSESNDMAHSSSTTSVDSSEASDKSGKLDQVDNSDNANDNYQDDDKVISFQSVKQRLAAKVSQAQHQRDMDKSNRDKDSKDHKGPTNHNDSDGPDK